MKRWTIFLALVVLLIILTASVLRSPAMGLFQEDKSYLPLVFKSLPPTPTATPWQAAASHLDGLPNPNHHTNSPDQNTNFNADQYAPGPKYANSYTYTYNYPNTYNHANTYRGIYNRQCDYRDNLLSRLWQSRTR